jgi:formylglycine-generating enzyme required for sulfatase activity
MNLEDLGNGISIEMVLIPAGKFKMGSPESEKGRYDDETQHEVTLTKPFYMGKYEVTQEQWEAVMKRYSLLEAWLPRFLWSGMYPRSNENLNLPVTEVSWEDCQVACHQKSPQYVKVVSGRKRVKHTRR